MSLTYGVFFLGLCVVTHLVVRYSLPHADPYLFPLAAVLASVGIVMVYRIDPTLARKQAQWFVAGLVLFAGNDLALRQQRLAVLERYRYTIALAGIVLLLLPRLPGIGQQVNGIYLNIKLGPIASSRPSWPRSPSSSSWRRYLRDNRQILVTAGRRVMGITFPPMKQFGPMLVIWGATMLMLVADRGAGHLTDVLRRLPRPALRGHRADLLPGRGPAVLRRRVVGRGPGRGRTCTTACRLAAPVRPASLQQASRGQLSAGPVALRPGRRRAAGDRL